ncbi:hypothetical protein FOZ63_026940 [Perkinsus olseni]|uniref:Uncharacterized protein n=1 Tax=Perkinsus olseni TaxID=32597 RepID=A0A7J6TEI7_PEROL|nr:hypothetical protein FOZ62_027940 [Perkinsus olseni]KAF4743331.1 hypothetical protein FOZ63_026940 [Perkinsus olseni]
MDMFPAIVQLRTIAWLPWALAGAMAFIAVAGFLFATSSVGKESPKPLAVRRSARLRERKELIGDHAVPEENSTGTSGKRAAYYVVMTILVSIFMALSIPLLLVTSPELTAILNPYVQSLVARLAPLSPFETAAEL